MTDIFTLKNLNNILTANTKYPIRVENKSITIKSAEETSMQCAFDLANFIELYYDRENTKAGLRLHYNGNIYEIATWNTTTGEGGTGNPFNQDLNTYDDVKFASISSDEPQLTLNRDIIIKDQLTISQLATAVQAPGVAFQIQTNGDAVIWSRADVNNNNPSDNPFFIASQDGGDTAMQFSLSSTDEALFVHGIASDAVSGSFLWQGGRVVNNGDSRPTYISLTNLFRISYGGNESFRNLNMNGNNITDINQATTNELLVNDERYIHNNGTISMKNLEFQTAQSVGLLDDPTSIASLYLKPSDVGMYYFTPGQEHFLSWGLGRRERIATGGPYSTGSPTFVDTVAPINYTGMPAGQWKVEWSFELSNTLLAGESKVQVLQQPDSLPDVVMCSTVLPTRFNNADYCLMSGTTMITNVSAITTDFTIQILAVSGTTLLRKVALFVYRIG